jgi:hypothetical protein
MSFDFGAFNNWGPLKKVAIRDVGAAFVGDAKIDAEWKDLNFHSRPDLANAIKEYAAVEAILTAAGAEVIKLPPAPGLTLDSIYTHDALIVTPRGLVKPRMGKPQRRQEAAVNGMALEALGFPVAGEITGDGKIEGGDLVSTVIPCWQASATAPISRGCASLASWRGQMSKSCGSTCPTTRAGQTCSTLCPACRRSIMIWRWSTRR